MRIVTLTGFLVARSLDEADRISVLVPDYVRETLAEPGCLTCEVWRSRADPVRFALREVYAGQGAFEAHRSRIEGRPWGKATANVPSDLRITEGLAPASLKGDADEGRGA
ncbi:MAG: antibiotic biosynthesis monooxygenase [Rhodobacteraceae bacterium]|nr:antibiotic biosynthesis monooxygenase [Paracoccaceae bacterium]